MTTWEHPFEQLEKTPHLQTGGVERQGTRWKTRFAGTVRDLSSVTTNDHTCHINRSVIHASTRSNDCWKQTSTLLESAESLPRRDERLLTAERRAMRVRGRGPRSLADDRLEANAQHPPEDDREIRIFSSGFKKLEWQRSRAQRQQIDW